MKSAEDDAATVEYYAVRLYRRYRHDVAEETRLAGVVEDVDGHQHAFHSQQELWQLLLRKVKRPRKTK